MSKTVLQLAQALGVALATTILTYLQGVDISQFGTGISSVIAGAVVGILVRLVGTLINSIGPKPDA